MTWRRETPLQTPDPRLHFHVDVLRDFSSTGTRMRNPVSRHRRENEGLI